MTIIKQLYFVRTIAKNGRTVLSRDFSTREEANDYLKRVNKRCQRVRLTDSWLVVE